MLYKEGFEASIRRWNAFWRHDVADRPPLVVHFRQEEREGQAGQTAERTIEDFERQFDLDYVAERVSLVEGMFHQRADFPDDTFPIVSAPSGLAVTGTFFGCKVMVRAGIYWVEPVIEHIEDWRNIDFAAGRRRMDRILEIIRYLVERSRGHYAVSLSAPDGPADMIVRMLGEQKLAIALYDSPAETKNLLEYCAGLWRDFVRRQLEIIPSYGGGTATSWNYWVPGKGTSFQEDFGAMVSPKQYRQIILKCDNQLVSGLDCAWYHVHSGGIHMAREIADSGAFKGIQICNDYPAGPSVREMLSTLQYLQKRVCLILRKFSLDQLDNVIGHLSSKGLAIDIQCYDSTVTEDIQSAQMSRQEAEEVIKWAEGWSRRAIGS